MQKALYLFYENLKRMNPLLGFSTSSMGHLAVVYKRSPDERQIFNLDLS